MPLAFLHNLRIGARLALGFAGVVLIILVLAATAWADLSAAREQTLELIGQQRERLLLAAEWRENIRVNSQRTMAIVLSGDKRLADHFGADIQALSKRTTEVQNRFAEIETTPEGIAAQARVVEARKAWLAARDAANAATAGGNAAAIEQATRAFVLATQAYAAEASALFQYEQARSEALGSASAEKLDTTLQHLYVTAAACVALACVLGWLLNRGIVRPLSLAQASAERIAAGDLSTDVPRGHRDEVGRLLGSLATMQESLRRLVGDIHRSSDGIGAATAEVAHGNHDLSVRTEQASASLQQTASTVEQIAQTMRQNADSATEASRLADAAAGVAGQGSAAVLQVVQTMDAINQSSRRIGDIVGVIDGIAFQTNILALNAAVEAARAGEQGRGFAVVASEVRALAQRSATAAREIKTLISESVDRVAAGAQEASAAGETIGQVVANVQRVSDIVREITEAASQQSQGFGGVNEAVSQLDQVTQQNAALVEESAAAAASLRDQAEALTLSVRRFRLA
ncbi:methyl-accepting chemotaxis protein [Azohydromonas aeria]|uniref:methyl-accepting chemotaxis protein n=1 Tax=Azohydromonas aeria TaxID=2590212 RepID=UPI0012FCF82C|nr:methyl-accepting chemotaxis protein [Azohydromonas aeria]